MLQILSKWLSGGSNLGRRAWLVVNYTPKGGSASDISEDVSKYFLSLSYTDNLSGQSDDISLTLEDREQVWQSDWMPELEARLGIEIHTLNWNSLTEGERQYRVGTYQIDEIECAGMPSTIQIKAVSVEADSTLRADKRNRTWNKVQIKQVASDICADNGISLFWDAEESSELDHVEQTDESDLEFLSKLTTNAGLSLKSEPDRLVIFDDAALESGSAQVTIQAPPKSMVSGYNLKAKTRDTYLKAHVRYMKDKDKKVIEAEFQDPNRTAGKTLEIDEQVENVPEAEKLAKKKLREANKDAMTASFSMQGDFSLMAGLLIQLNGYGKFDGKYIVTKATHDIGEGYRTSIEMRRCLSGY